MTRLTVAAAPALEFSVNGRNSITEGEDEGLVFYEDVTKVQVLPDEHRFTMQIITPDLHVEMDFPDAGTVREALGLFESKKASKVEAEAPGSVRLTPVEPDASKVDAGAKELAVVFAHDSFGGDDVELCAGVSGHGAKRGDGDKECVKAA